MITSTLKDIVKALDSNDEQRVRDHQGRWLSDGRCWRSVGTDMSLYYDEGVSRWLGGNDVVGWKVQEGLALPPTPLRESEGMTETNSWEVEARSYVEYERLFLLFINQVVS